MRWQGTEERPPIGAEGGGDGARAAGRKRQRGGEFAVAARRAGRDREGEFVDSAFEGSYGGEGVGRVGKGLELAREVLLHAGGEGGEPRGRRLGGGGGQVAAGEGETEEAGVVPRRGRSRRARWENDGGAYGFAS